MMKKLLAVLLAVTLIFSVMAIGFVALAADGEAPADSGSGRPDWLNRLIERLTFVFAKLMLKFGIKLALKSAL